MPTLKTNKPSLKSRAMSLVRALPKDSSWDDLMYRIYVRQKIEAGLADIRAGRVHSHESIRREFGLAS
jgi:predicted transcriptional regulator